MINELNGDEENYTLDNKNLFDLAAIYRLIPYYIKLRKNYKRLGKMKGLYLITNKYDTFKYLKIIPVSGYLT